VDGKAYRQYIACDGKLNSFIIQLVKIKVKAKITPKYTTGCTKLAWKYSSTHS
jgi:hypothetical protein